MKTAMQENEIPEMTNSLGRYWDQPDRSEIKIGNDIALMSQETFNKLADYSLSSPTGVYEGKMWKGKYKNGWHLLWYYPNDDPKKMSIGSRKIMFHNGQPNL